MPKVAISESGEWPRRVRGHSFVQWHARDAPHGIDTAARHKLEERAGQARATKHAPFKLQVERKMAPGEGLFS
jgi:hypothetical protein